MQVVTAGVVAAWAVPYVVVVTTAPLSYDPATESAAKVNREFALLLAVPTALWVTAALLLLDHWWSRTGVRMSAMDPPGRLLAAAVATLPDHRRGWRMAMNVELAEVRGRSARWRFALSSARAALRLPPLGGWPVLALVAGVVVAAVAAAGLAVGAAVPGLGVSAVSFVGLVGAMVVLVVARLRRMGLPVPAPTLLVAGGVAAAITMTVTFLLRDPAAAGSLPRPTRCSWLPCWPAACGSPWQRRGRWAPTAWHRTSASPPPSSSWSGKAGGRNGGDRQVRPQAGLVAGAGRRDRTGLPGGRWHCLTAATTKPGRDRPEHLRLMGDPRMSKRPRITTTPRPFAIPNSLAPSLRALHHSQALPGLGGRAGPTDPAPPNGGQKASP